MAAFAPVYRPPKFQQSILTREQKRERKRKRNADDDEDEKGPEDSDDEKLLPDSSLDAPRIPHPVNKRDPYYVAGWPREKPLPGGNFPHSALPDVKQSSRTIEEELANLNHPLYAPKSTLDDPRGSLKRRHLDNLTAILHKCMLNNDWKRASRVWGLILRTEVGGYGPDVRQNGRWMVGAELLMRRSKPINQTVTSDRVQQGSSTTASQILDEGFKAARDYYERLVLQYPHLQRTHHSVVSSKVIYPALFNVWAYEVQYRSERARKALGGAAEGSEIDDTASVTSDTSEKRRAAQEIREHELAEALPIAQRLDDLLLNPPYDTHPELLELRGMIGLWLSDLHKIVAGRDHEGQIDSIADEDNIRVFSAADKAHVASAAVEKKQARRIFQKMADANMPLSSENLAFLREADDEDEV